MIRTLITTLACTVILASPSRLSAQAANDIPDKLQGGDFLMPIRDEKGRKEMLIGGKSANKSGGYITLLLAKITLYRYSGDEGQETQIRIFSPAATYDNAKGVASSGKRVNIRMVPTRKPGEADTLAGQAIIDGVGFDLTMKNKDIPLAKQMLAIRSAVRVRLYRDTKIRVGKNADGKETFKNVINETVITSKSMTYNMTDNEIDFIGDVQCIDQTYGVEDSVSFTLDADKMTVYLKSEGDGKTGSAPKAHNESAFDRILAIDNVELVAFLEDGQGKATGQRCESSFEQDDQKRKVTILTISQDPLLTMNGTELLNAEKVVYKRFEGDGHKSGKFHTEGGRPTLKIDNGGKGNAFGKTRKTPKSDK